MPDDIGVIENIPENLDYAQEYRKKELRLSINAFDEPLELSGPKAWAQLITDLLFTRKGSRPSNPDIGIDIQSYDFTFAAESISLLETEAKRQIERYLPDIPLASLTVGMSNVANQTDVLIITINLAYNQKIETAVVAGNVGNKLLDWVLVL